jgi:hypothetical protein
VVGSYAILTGLNAGHKMRWYCEQLTRPIRDWICGDFNLAHWKAIKIVRKSNRP